MGRAVMAVSAMVIGWGALVTQAQTMAELTIIVQDARTGEPVAARVEVKDSEGRRHGDEIEGYGIPADGAVTVKVPAGSYSVSASARNDYDGNIEIVEAVEGEPGKVVVGLKRRLNLVESGWLCGEGHSHQGRWSGEDADQSQVLDLLRRYGLAEGLNYVDLGQPHAGFRGKTAEEFDEFIGEACDPSRHVCYRLGAEFPKTRFGHTWWFGLKELDPPIHRTMDETHEAWYQSKTGWTLDEDKHAYAIAPVYDIWQQVLEQGAVGVHAHPTSWWYEDRKDGQGKMFVSNLPAWLAFDLLCERQIETLVAMGYRDEHVFYQALWFDILNRGYRMPGVAESDGSLTKRFRNNFIGQRRTYAYAGPGGDYEAYLEAIRGGRSFMSSGPILLATAKGQVAAGLELRADGEPVNLVITAYADSLPEEFISYVFVYRNGRVLAVKDCREERPRLVEWSVELNEREPAWYVVKCYGSRPPAEEGAFEILTYARHLLESGTDSPGDIGPVAMTNPLYFVPEGYERPGKIVPRYRIEVRDAEDATVSSGEYEVLNFGERIDAGRFSEGVILGQWPATSEVVVRASAGEGSARVFFDYKPVQKAMVAMRAGEFVKEYPRIRPGQVPVEYFRLDELSEALREVEITLVVRRE